MKKFQFLLLLSIMGLYVSAQTVEKTYHFDNPVINKIQGYNQISFEGCMQTAAAGNPTLPYQSVSLLLPMGAEAQSVEVELSDFQELEGSYQLFPYQPARPYSKPERTVFMKNEEIYASKSIYPSSNQNVLTTNYMNGFAFAFTNFTPVQYVPSTGKVMFAKTATVRIKTAAAKSDHSNMLWCTPAIENRIKALAQNPEAVDSYKTRARSISGYDLLVITSETFVNDFDEYIDFYNNNGLRTEIQTLETIYSEMSGIDNQDKIRNYIIQEYENEGIMMVLLGGDVNILPHRGFYCYVTSGGGDQEDNSIPADLYYCGLDGTWNDNNDNKWGEIGEDDLLPEIGVARMSFQNTTALNNMINKTLKYQREPILGEFHDVMLAGEALYDNPQTFGSDYLELLIGEHNDNGYTTIGIPEDYNFTRLYEEEGNWSGTLQMNAINEGTQYVHHVGHANSTYVAGWSNSDITNSNFSGVDGVQHNYTFMHSHGCICAAFDEDCIMERMVSIANFCVCAIGNSRYGWFNEGQTEGPSGHLHREMTDAFYHERIPYIGMALSESKCQTAPFVTAPGQWEEGALRWNFYDLNILGDVAVSPWLDEPFTPEVSYTPELIIGTASTEVTVTNENGVAQKNFRCSIYNDNELLGFGVTGENGVANVVFTPAIDNVYDLKLVVTGLNAHPQTLDMVSVPNNAAYVVYDSYSINGGNTQINFNDNVSFNMTIKNVGSVNANNVTATLSCDKPDYITFTDATENIAAINGNASVTLDNCFAFNVCDSVPDNTSIKFTLTCTDGSDTWTSNFNTKVYAPQFRINSITFDDSNNNGAIEPGETVTIHFNGDNAGGCAAPSSMFAVYCSFPEMSYEQDVFNLGTLEAGQTFTSDFTFTVGENIEEGVAYRLPFAAYSGRYVMFDYYTFSIGKLIEDFETGDFSSFDWQHEGQKIWSVVAENPHSGSFCAKSGSIGDTYSTTLYIAVEFFNNDEISFYRKVSSESNYDKLHFYVDATEVANWSGELDWELVTAQVNQGTHTFKWTYTKDSSVSNGSDCAWLDDITFPPTTVITDIQTVVEENVSIYPNPNNGSFNINIPDSQYDVTVYNSIGQVVYRLDAVAEKVNVNIENLASGLYFVNVKSDEMNLTKKVVVSRE